VKKGRGARGEGREEDAQVFREAVGDVKPIKAAKRAEPYRVPPKPLPARRDDDEHAVLEDLVRLATRDGGDFDWQEDQSFLRPGLPRDILRKLRRTHWSVQDHLDLHGLTGDEAVAEAAAFIAACTRRGIRCVRIVHGKGLRSPGREPVLKRQIRNLLARLEAVLAFVEPHASEGGSGAVVVLLEA
jgi:DNA-nicking Smr family endonuclease